MNKKLIIAALICSAPSALAMEAASQKERGVKPLYYMLITRIKADFQSAQEFLNKNPNVDLNAGLDGRGTTLLHFAARNGDKKVCTFLLNNGALVDSRDQFGNTPMDYTGGKIQETCEFLLCSMKRSVLLLKKQELEQAEKRILTLECIYRYRKDSPLAVLPKEILRLILTFDSDYLPVLLHRCIRLKDIPPKYASLLTKVLLAKLIGKTEAIISDARSIIRSYHRKSLEVELTPFKAHLASIKALLGNGPETDMEQSANQDEN